MTCTLANDDEQKRPSPEGTPASNLRQPRAPLSLQRPPRASATSRKLGELLHYLFSSCIAGSITDRARHRQPPSQRHSFFVNTRIFNPRCLLCHTSQSQDYHFCET